MAGEMGKTCLFAHPTLRRAIWPVHEKFFLDSQSGAQCNTRSEVKLRACDSFQTIILQFFRLVTSTKTKRALNSDRRTADCLMKSYLNPTPRLWDICGGLVGIKLMSSVTVRSQTLFFV